MTPLSSHRPPAGQAGEEPRLSSELIDGLVRDVCAIPPGPERQAARERVIRRLVPLARRIAAKYRNIAGEEQDDLFQAACLGLVRAVDGYDPDRGHAFLSYAVPTVAGEVKRHLRDRTGTLRIPRPVQDARQRVNRARGELEQLNGRPATRAEVAAYCDLPTEAVTEALRSESVRRPRPLDAPADGTDLPGPTPSEVIGGCDPALELLVERVTLIRLLNELPDRERRILYLRFFEDRTQQQIASAVGISQMHVSRLLARCLAHLREALTDPYGTEVTGAGPSARAKDAAAGLRTAGPPHLPPEEPRRRGGPVGAPPGQRPDAPAEAPSNGAAPHRRSVRRDHPEHGTAVWPKGVRRPARRTASAPGRPRTGRTGAGDVQPLLTRVAEHSSGAGIRPRMRPPPHSERGDRAEPAVYETPLGVIPRCRRSEARAPGST